MKHPPLITLIPLVFLSLASCKQDHGAAVPPLEMSQPDPQVKELELQLSELQEQLRDERDLRLRQNNEQTEILSELKKTLAEMAAAQKASSMDASAISEAEMDRLAADAEDAEARRMARRNAQGEKHASLTTVSGVQYHDSVINRVTDIGVVIRHRGGVARISFSDLSPAWQERFYYDEEVALRAQEDEARALAKHERAAEDALLALEKQKQADADARSLADLTQEVERLKQQAEAPAPAGRDQILVRPPIILNQRSHFLNQSHNRPILKPALVRPPVVRTTPKVGSKIVPTIRSSRPVPTIRSTGSSSNLRPSRSGRTSPSRSSVPQRSRSVVPKFTPQRR